MPNQEVVFNILDLLETMEEGLNYIKEKLNELNIEATIPILVDVIAAFSAVEQSITPILDELEENKIIERTKELRKRLDIMVEEYEKDKGQNILKIMKRYLEPAFDEWKEEIELKIRPMVSS